jgi:hypothetical protein
MAVDRRIKVPRIRAAAVTWRDLLQDGGLRPSTYLLAIMRDESRPEELRVAIAEKLIQYELPRLASIEAEITDTRKTHEEWLEELDREPARNRGGATLQ